MSFKLSLKYSCICYTLPCREPIVLGQLMLSDLSVSLTASCENFTSDQPRLWVSTQILLHDPRNTGSIPHVLSETDSHSYNRAIDVMQERRDGHLRRGPGCVQM